MRRVSKRSHVSPRTEGPRVGAFVTLEGVTVRVIESGERPTLPRATVRAESDDPRHVAAAAALCQARIMAAALRPVSVSVTV